MDFGKLVFFVSSAFILALILSNLAISRLTFYDFSLGVPEEVEATPGETVTVNGTILVTGWYWLHNFNLTLEGLPYEYEITPGYWQDVRILREWNPERGVYRVPEKFFITIDVPEDAYGVHAVTVTGQEHRSWRQVKNSTFFILKIKPVVKPKPNLTVSDILLPEKINASQPFKITFRINNKGAIGTNATIRILLPEKWEVENETQRFKIKANASAIGTFNVTPAETSGNVSLYLEYPYKETILNLTRVGPYLKPIVPTTTTTTTIPEKMPGKPKYVSLIERIRSFVTPFLTPLGIGIVIILLIIIVWLIQSIIRFYRRKKSPERMKKQINFSELGLDQL